MLPVIIERKQYPDFRDSMKDRRYTTQKAKMLKCGVEDLIYLVEGNAKRLRNTIVEHNLQQAIWHTMLQDGFLVLFSSHYKYTSLNLAYD